METSSDMDKSIAIISTEFEELAKHSKNMDPSTLKQRFKVYSEHSSFVKQNSGDQEFLAKLARMDKYIKKTYKKQIKKIKARSMMQNRRKSSDHELLMEEQRRLHKSHQRDLEESMSQLSQNSESRRKGERHQKNNFLGGKDETLETDILADLSRLSNNLDFKKNAPSASVNVSNAMERYPTAQPYGNLPRMRQSNFTTKKSWLEESESKVNSTDKPRGSGEPQHVPGVPFEDGLMEKSFNPFLTIEPNQREDMGEGGSNNRASDDYLNESANLAYELQIAEISQIQQSEYDQEYAHSLQNDIALEDSILTALEDEEMKRTVPYEEKYADYENSGKNLNFKKINNMKSTMGGGKAYNSYSDPRTSNNGSSYRRGSIKIDKREGLSRMVQGDLTVLTGDYDLNFDYPRGPSAPTSPDALIDKYIENIYNLILLEQKAKLEKTLKYTKNNIKVEFFNETTANRVLISINKRRQKSVNGGSQIGQFSFENLPFNGYEFRYIMVDLVNPLLNESGDRKKNHSERSLRLQARAVKIMRDYYVFKVVKQGINPLLLRLNDNSINRQWSVNPNISQLVDWAKEQQKLVDNYLASESNKVRNFIFGIKKVEVVNFGWLNAFINMNNSIAQFSGMNLLIEYLCKEGSKYGYLMDFVNDMKDRTDFELNMFQAKAIINALEKQFTILQGPPGTGKSTLSALIIRIFVEIIYREKNKTNPNRGTNSHEQNLQRLMSDFSIPKELEGILGGEDAAIQKKILVCADSNKAVDVITLKLIEQGVKVVRVMANAYYDKNEYDPKMKPFALSADTKNNGHINQKEMDSALQAMKQRSKLRSHLNLNNQYQNRNKPWNALKNITKVPSVEDADVVCCTLNVAQTLKKIFRVKGKFEYLVIDEATQTTELQMFKALKNTTDQTKIILVGDQMQLGPVLESFEAERRGYKSMFERMVEDEHQLVMLRYQYRMHPCICEDSNRLFYHGKIISGVMESDRTLYKAMSPSVFKGNKPKIFFHIEGKEIRQGKSMVNVVEVELIRKILNAMKRARFHRAKPSLAIIATYKAQIDLIKNACETLRMNQYFEVDIDTVDAFQGRDVDFVILSMVRSNRTMDIGFMVETRRLNVAITRCKEGLIIVGNSITLGGGHNDFKSLIKEYEKQGCLKDGFTDQDFKNGSLDVEDFLDF